MKIYSITIVSFLFLSSLYAGCGSCKVSNTKAKEPALSFATSVAKDGSVKGMVLASCGMCNFGMKNQKNCSLAIQVGERAYTVKGSKIDDHGDSHAKDGFCNAVRIADVDGKVKDGVFLADAFTLKKN